MQFLLRLDMKKIKFNTVTITHTIVFISSFLHISCAVSPVYFKSLVIQLNHYPNNFELQYSQDCENFIQVDFALNTMA